MKLYVYIDYFIKIIAHLMQQEIKKQNSYLALSEDTT